MTPDHQLDDDAVRFGRPVIFGDAARPLSGRLHAARGPVKGAVVICNPWGNEENSAYVSLQLLAGRLAAGGLETLRFDYDGCGNSWGDAHDPARFARWLASCEAAIDFMSARTPGQVRVVGLRLGASLALLAAASRHVEAAVLWDPVVVGRRYLRSLRAMTLMGVGAAADPLAPGSLVVIGHFLSAQTIAHLEALDLITVRSAQIGGCLVIAAPHARDAQGLASHLNSLGVPTRSEPMAGTELCLDGAAEVAVVPVAILDRIEHWLTSNSREVAQSPLPSSFDTTLIAPLPHAWREEHLRIGPSRLSAVLTMPAVRRRQGVVIMINNGAARAIGPARAWVEWTRSWAQAGIASLRVDLAGLGESRPHPQRKHGAQYPPDATADIQEAIAAMDSRGLSPAVAVGLCSGAFLSVDAAGTGASLAAVLAINPQLHFLPDPPGSPHRLRRAAPVTTGWVQSLFENTRAGRYAQDHLPYPFWWLLDLLRLHPHPLRGADAGGRRIRIELVFGKDDIGLVQLRLQARAALRRWQQSGQLTIVPGLDHSMFAPGVRREMEARGRSFLEQVLPPYSEAGSETYSSPLATGTGGTSPSF